MKCDRFIDELVVGYICEWDLSSGDLIEHKVYDDPVYYMALSGDRIVVSCKIFTRVRNLPTFVVVAFMLFFL